MLTQAVELVRYVADAYRTSPAGGSLLLYGASFCAFLYERPSAVAGAIPAIIVGTVWTARDSRLRSRLERAVERHGYDDRLFRPVLRGWGTRQAAMVAAERAGCREQYVELSTKCGKAPHLVLKHEA